MQKARPVPIMSSGTSNKTPSSSDDHYPFSHHPSLLDNNCLSPVKTLGPFNTYFFNNLSTLPGSNSLDQLYNDASSLYDTHTGDPLQDDILQLCRESGIEDIAKEVGVIKNGEIPAFKEYALGAPGRTSPYPLPQNLVPPALGNGESASARAQSVALIPTKVESNEDENPQSRKRKRKTQGASSDTISAAEMSGGSSLAIPLNGQDKVGSKGLRHFSLKVCQKVESKRTTSYNEVADELVGEFASENVVSPVEQKNIRRRVYDVLNVLMAMNIISKDKKEIHWIGLPTSSDKSQEESLRRERAQRLERIKKKKENLIELQCQQIAYRNLLARNSSPEYTASGARNRIYLPFIVINTRSNTVINCEVAHDRTKYFFNFSHPFAIHDDNEVLRRMGMCNPDYAAANSGNTNTGKHLDTMQATTTTNNNSSNSISTNFSTSNNNSNYHFTSNADANGGSHISSNTNFTSTISIVPSSFSQ